jgi:hypothetical protein
VVIWLTVEEVESNSKPIGPDQSIAFDPNYTLSNIHDGFRIFSAEGSLKDIPGRRFKFRGPVPETRTVFLHAQVQRSGEFNPVLKATIKIENNARLDRILSATFDRPEIPRTFNSALLSGLLNVLESTYLDVPLLICSSSEFLSRVIVKERRRSGNESTPMGFDRENEMLALHI